MRFSLLLLAAEVASASSWFGRTAYNKWHETELERWLSDHNIPYPTPADRKDLENLIKQNWNDYVLAPYNSWDINQLQKYVTLKGEGIKKGTEKNKDALVAQVKAGWTDTEDRANEAYANTRDWIFDTWSESQLKAFADRNGIPVPQPRTRDTILKTIRENYQITAEKLSETAAYPGNWLWETWSDSDLKTWLDERGYPVPQHGRRDQLIAAVRRNSRIASNNLAALQSSLSAKAAAATQAVNDAVFDTWSDSQIKQWADERGIQVPQGSKRNELIALARKHNAQLKREANRLSASAASAYGAATSSAGNEYAKATDDMALKLEDLQRAFYSYLDWAKSQLGLASATASESVSSASKHASKSASSASKSAASAYSSATKEAQKTYSSATSKAKVEL